MNATALLRTLANIALLLAIVYGGLLALLYFFQSRLLYFPDLGREVSTTPRTVGLAFDEVWLDVEPHVRLHAWYVPRDRPKGVALILHGNAGSIALRVDWLRMFHELGYASFVVDYRGYGRSTGAPSESGTYADAQAAWDHLVRVRGIPARDVVILGESLGGAIAAWLAARTTPRALILQSAFTSVPDVAAGIYPFFPVRWISRFNYDTRASLREISVPLLVAHSRADEVIPFHHGQSLYAAAREPKRFLELSGGHNEGFIFTRRAWVESLAAFLDAAGMRDAGETK
jgi:fermentation-respiration switch protein FrsA (DUF1100 family)